MYFGSKSSRNIFLCVLIFGTFSAEGAQSTAEKFFREIRDRISKEEEQTPPSPQPTSNPVSNFTEDNNLDNLNNSDNINSLNNNNNNKNNTTLNKLRGPLSSVSSSKMAVPLPVEDSAYAPGPDSLAPSAKLGLLRDVMNEYGLDAYIIFTSDAHNSEYLPLPDQRRAYITNFNGSAGTAVVGLEKAWLSTDGRYFLQAENQLDLSVWTLLKDGTPGVPTIYDFFSSHPEIKKVGFDPFTSPTSSIQMFQDKYSKTKQTVFVPIDQSSPKVDNSKISSKTNPLNLVDLVWAKDHFHPEYKKDLIRKFDPSFTDVSSSQKLIDIRSGMKKNNADLLVVSELDEVAWLCNLRGRDISYTHVFVSYALITPSEATVYIKFSSDKTRLTPDINSFLNENGIHIKDYESFFDDFDLKIKEISSIENNKETPRGGKVWMSPGINYAVFSMGLNIRGINETLKGTIRLYQTPLSLAKGVKSDMEVVGCKDAHLHDGIALVMFFAWLDNLDSVSLRNHDELSISNILDSFRGRQLNFLSLSFPAISSIGPNSAVIHYRPTKKTAKKLSENVYLIDSGGHYRGGTTDTTRAIHFGTPTAWEKECYTRVLKGHIALGRAIFPPKLKGSDLDILARQFIFEIGFDYLHGTGHGVGAELSVHESPPNVSLMRYVDRPLTFTYERKTSGSPEVSLEGGSLPEGSTSTSTFVERAASNVPATLVPNMIMSDEPGLYIDGQFGIRIENMMVVKNVTTPFKFNSDKPYLGFEMLTKVPYCRKMIDVSLLSASEIQWIDEYHQNVRIELTNEWNRKSEDSTEMKNIKERNSGFEDTFINYLNDATSPLMKY